MCGARYGAPKAGEPEYVGVIGTGFGIGGGGNDETLAGTMHNEASCSNLVPWLGPYIAVDRSSRN